MTYPKWISLLCIAVLLIASVLLKFQNRQLAQKNEVLILENDSILSAKIKLEKDFRQLEASIDSLRHGEPVHRQIVFPAYHSQ